MNPLFGRKKGNYPSDSKWTVFHGEYQGHPIFVRLNDSARELLGSLDYRRRIGVAIPLLKPNESGLPSDSEIQILNQIEDELSAQFERNQMAIQVLSITTNGMREFVFYSRNDLDIESCLGDIRAKFSSYKIQSYSEDDKDWGLYTEFGEKH
jgi:hypothetical protein